MARLGRPLRLYVWHRPANRHAPCSIGRPASRNANADARPIAAGLPAGSTKRLALALGRGLDDFDRYVEENGIPEEDYPAAFALWIAERTGGPGPRFERIERKPSEDGLVIEGDAL